MALKKENKIIVAKLTLIVEFDNNVDREDIERILDEAKAYGNVKQATFQRLVPTTEELA